MIGPSLQIYSSAVRTRTWCAFVLQNHFN